jgi:cytochrome P450
MELRVAIGSLLECFPDLQMGVPQDELDWKTGGLVRGLKSLPVTW